MNILIDNNHETPGILRYHIPLTPHDSLSSPAFSHKKAGAEVFVDIGASHLSPFCGLCELTAHRDPGPAGRRRPVLLPGGPRRDPGAHARAGFGVCGGGEKIEEEKVSVKADKNAVS